MQFTPHAQRWIPDGVFHLDWQGYYLMSQEVARQVAGLEAFRKAAGDRGRFPAKEEIINPSGRGS